MPAIVSSSLVREWAQRALSGLGDARVEIDALNVFPVPDGDTGTNLYLTMESACEAVDQCWSDAADAPGVDEAARAMSTGALMGARGNSGVILSQILRGTSEILGGLDRRRRARRIGCAPAARPGRGPRLRGGRPPRRGHDPDRGPGGRRLGRGAPPGGCRRCRRRDGGSGAGCARRARADPHACWSRCAWPGSSTRVDGDSSSCSTRSPRSSRACAARAATSGIHAPVPRPVDVEASHHYGGPAYEVMFLLEADDEAVPALRADARLPRRQPRGRRRRPALERPCARRRRRCRGRGGDGGRPAVPPAHHAPRARSCRRRGRVDGRALVAVSHGPGVADLLGSAGVGIVPALARQRPSTAELLDAIRLDACRRGDRPAERQGHPRRGRGGCRAGARGRRCASRSSPPARSCRRWRRWPCTTRRPGSTTTSWR